MSIQIQLRRDTAANWTSVNPILAEGEAGYETDTGKIKLGDGVTAWTSLVYRFLGVLDHGLLTGLADDDHTQYHNDSRALTWLGTRSTSDLAEGSNLYHTDERAQDAVGTILLDTASINLTYNDGTPNISADVLPAGVDHNALANTHNLTTDIDHNSLTNYDANKHIDHTAVTITAGNGLSGGGDISSNRTIDLDLNELTTVTAVDTDYVSIVDVSDTNASKKALISDITSLATSACLKLDTSNGPLTGDLGITKANPRISLTDSADADSPTAYFEKLTTLNEARWVSKNRLYQAGTGLTLNGSGFANRASVSLGTVFTVEAWYKTSSTASQMILSGTAGTDIHLWFSASNTITVRTTAVLFASWTVTYADNVFHHWVVVCNGTSVTLYKDNVSQGTVVTASASSRGYTNIGNYGADGGHKCVGTIDQLVIWNYALSAGDVATRYNGGAGSELSSYTNVIAEYRLNSTYTDSSPNAYNCSAGGSGNSFTTGQVSSSINTPSDVPVLTAKNNSVNLSYASVTLGYYSGSNGTENYYDGLNHYHRVLGTTRLQVTSAGITVTGAATISSITASTLTISGALTMSGVINGCSQISVTNGFYANAGTNLAPSFSASSDSNSGMYFSAADTLAWSCGGTQYMSLAAAALIMQTHIRGNSGSTTFPTYAFSANTNTGIYRPAASMMGFVTAGTERARLNDVGNIGIGTTTISARLHIISTTEQTRIGYDASNYYSTTVSSAGAVTFNAVGASAGFTFSDSITMDDAKDIIFNATTGTKLGTATTQKLGFWNATPIVQPAAANQATLTNSTGGAYDATLAAVTDTSASDQSGAINDNFTDVYTLLTEIRTALVDAGLIKGAA